jgi:hypothetical protein
MNEITPRFGLPLDFPGKERDLEAPKFQLALNESNARGPDGQRQGPVRPQSQFFYADPNGAGGTGHGSGGTGGTSGSGGTGGHGAGGPPGVAAGVAAGAVGGAVGAASGTHGTKEVETKNHADGTKTVKLKDFHPPGWPAGATDACYKLACDGASQTVPAGQDVTGGGGIILYDDKTGLGSEIIKRPAQRIHTDKDASAVALEQIKRHIDDGRAVVAGVSEPASSEIVDGPKIVNGKEKPGTQPVTNHYVAVYGYETDAKGKITGLHAKDNAVPGAPDIFFKVGADGSITKPEDPKAPSKYMKQEYQLSEVKFHEGFEYKGGLQPKNDDGNIMFWPHL